jgi:hypothetical protein
MPATSAPAALLMTAALVEGVTGLSLMLAPSFLVGLLFASDLDATGLSVARIAGMVLFSFALASWLAARTVELKALTVGLLVYNLLVGAYFVFVGARAPDTGPLLWPVAVFHVFFAALLARSLRRRIPEEKK